MNIITGVNSAIVHNNKILLIKRIKEPYTGYWSMPGGKLEFGETIEECAVRELKEETNIDSEFERLGGIASEVVYNKGKKKAHFLLFVCKLKPLHLNHKETNEGKVRWVSVKDLDKEKIIPSDVLMIKEFILKENNLDVHKIKMIEDGDRYYVEAFEK